MVKTQRPRRIVALFMAVLAALAMAPARAAQAASPAPTVYPPTAHPYGHTYPQWAVRFFQWVVATPASQVTPDESSGAYCDVGQSGPVWYLIGNENKSATSSRMCTVPASKALFVSATGILECSTAEGSGTTFAALRSCVTGYMNMVTKLDVTVDGVHISHILTRYRFTTPLFTVNYPADNVWQLPGPGTTKSVAQGVWVILAPLAAGQHTIILYGEAPSMGWESTVTYHLTVRS